MRDILGYRGKRVVITGAASGMGLAASKLLNELEAEVYALDVKEVPCSVKKFLATDLADKASIDAAVSQLPAAVEKVFCCSGVAGPISRGARYFPVDVVMINFVGHRHLIESLLPRIPAGGAIAMIASIGGMGWVQNTALAQQLIATTGFDEARAWLESHQDDPMAVGGPPQQSRPYKFSKECMIFYAKVRSWQLASRQIRINTLSPGATATPLLPSFGENAGRLDPEAKRSTSPFGRASVAEEQAEPLIFLNSDMARYISGSDLIVDYGFTGGIVSGQYAGLRG